MVLRSIPQARRSRSRRMAIPPGEHWSDGGSNDESLTVTGMEEGRRPGSPERGTGPSVVRHGIRKVCRSAQFPVSFSRSAARASSEARVPSLAGGAAGRESEPSSSESEADDAEDESLL